MTPATKTSRRCWRGCALPAERPALTFYRGRRASGGWTYGELLAAVDGSRAGCGTISASGSGDRVAVLSPNRLEVPALFLAAMQLGAAVVPLNPTTPPADWDYILAHSEARLLFGARDLLATARSGRPTSSAPSRTSRRPAPRPARRQRHAGGTSLGADELAIVLYTSGTTGNPKGVALGQASLLANAWSMASNFRFAGRDAAGGAAALPRARARLRPDDHADDRRPPGLHRAVRPVRLGRGAARRVGHADQRGADAVAAAACRLACAPSKIPTLRALLVSSAPLTASLARAFEEKTKLRLIQGWGLSEYTNFACCLPPDLARGERRQLPLRRGADRRSGARSPGTEVKVVGAGRRDAACRAQRGELCVRGHSTMLAYFRDDAATGATLGADGWLRTGDEGFFRLDRRRPGVLHHRPDQRDDHPRRRQVQPAGDRATDPGRGCPRSRGGWSRSASRTTLHGEEVGAYLESEELGDDLRARLTKVVGGMPLDARPKIILFGAAPIPRTHTGKIQRRKLHAAFAPFRDCRGALRIERAG